MSLSIIKYSVSEEQFYEELANFSHIAVKELKDFVDELQNLDIFPVFGSSSLNLRWLPEENLKMNFGSIYKTGVVDTGPCNWIPERIGKIAIGHDYQKNITKLIPDANVREHEKPSCWGVHKNNKRINVLDLLPITKQWKEVIKNTQSEILHFLSS